MERLIGVRVDVVDEALDTGAEGVGLWCFKVFQVGGKVGLKGLVIGDEFGKFRHGDDGVGQGGVECPVDVDGLAEIVGELLAADGAFDHGFRNPAALGDLVEVPVVVFEPWCDGGGMGGGHGRILWTSRQ